MKTEGAAFLSTIDYNLPHVNNELHNLTGNGFELPGASRYADRDWTVQEQGYAEMVSLIDDYVGELVAKLRSLGLDGNTLVMFTSDNGPTGVRGLESLARFAATGGLKGMKGMFFEGGIRVPMIAWWPGTITAGTSTQEITTFWDVLPTFAELIGRPELAIGEYCWSCSARAMPRERVLYWRWVTDKLCDMAIGSGCITQTRVSRTFCLT